MENNRADKVSEVVTFSSLLILALIIRILLFHIVTRDMVDILTWYDTFTREGRIAAWKEAFYSYNPALLYLIDIMTLSRRFIPKEIAVKLISVAFDVVGAIAVYKIVEIKYPLGRLKMIGFFLYLFSPIVFVGSGLWGQSDSVYTSFLLWSLFFILKEKPSLAVICFTLSLAFKLQAMIFSPVFLILFLYKKINFFTFFLIPVVYILSFVPALIFGGPVGQIIEIYFGQYQSFSNTLSLNAPNIFMFIPAYPDIELKGLIGFVIAAVFVIGYILLRWKKWKILDQTSLCFDAAFITCIIPFFIPRMHERYFFPASAFFLVLALINHKFTWMAVLSQAATLISYIPYLALWRDLKIFPQLGAIFNILIMVGMFYFAWINRTAIFKVIPESEIRDESRNKLPTTT